MKQRAVPSLTIVEGERAGGGPPDSALVVAKVMTADSDALVEVEIDDRQLTARRAFSCLIEPIAGDRALVARTADGIYVIAILERIIADRATIALPSTGALTIAAKSIRIAARDEATIDARTVSLRGGALSLISDTLTLVGRLATLVAETIRLSSKTHEMSAELISATCLDRVTLVERADVLRAGTLTQTIDAVATTTAPIAVIATEEDLRLDGKRVTVG